MPSLIRVILLLMLCGVLGASEKGVYGYVEYQDIVEAFENIVLRGDEDALKNMLSNDVTVHDTRMSKSEILEWLGEEDSTFWQNIYGEIGKGSSCGPKSYFHLIEADDSELVLMGEGSLVTFYRKARIGECYISSPSISIAETSQGYLIIGIELW